MESQSGGLYRRKQWGIMGRNMRGFYDKDHQPYLYTARGVGVVGETTEEIKETLHKMLDCLNKPVLMKADFNNNIKVWLDEDPSQDS